MQREAERLRESTKKKTAARKSAPFVFSSAMRSRWLLLERPAEAIGNDVQILFGGHGRVMVPDRGAEDLSFSVGIHPNGGLGLFRFPVCSPRENGGRIEDFVYVVEFTFWGRPSIGQTLNSWMIAVGVVFCDLNLGFGSVVAGHHAKKFRPRFFTALNFWNFPVVGVHGAMQEERGQAFFVYGGYGVYKLYIGIVRKAVVVDDEIIAFFPPFFGKERFVLSLVLLVGDGPFNIHAATNAFADDVFLLGVVVTASAGDHQTFEWFLFFGRSGARQPDGCTEYRHCKNRFLHVGFLFS